MQKRGTSPECLICKSQKHCDAFNERKDQDKFDAGISSHAQKHGRKLVCKTCQAIGFSPRDCRIYVFAGSQTTEAHTVGHLKLTHADLDRHSKNPASNIRLCCVDCKTQTAGQRGQKRSKEDPSEDPRQETMSTCVVCYRHCETNTLGDAHAKPHGQLRR